MDYLNIIYILLISLGINYFFFIFAWIFKSDVFTDLTYALSFISINLIFFVWHRNFNYMHILIYILINIWAIRLGRYLFLRIIKMKVDHRFDKMRNSFIKFSLFWTLQAISVWIIITPCTMFLTIPGKILDHSSYGWVAIFIFLIGIFALIFETIADIQSNNFYNKMKSKKPDCSFLNTGLWKASRHPNYFGEIVFWYSMTLTTIVYTLINSQKQIYYINILFLISPIYLNFILVYVSGIRMSELRWINCYQTNKEFKDYIHKTSALIPFLGKKGPMSILKNKYEQMKSL
ncbi:MAG: DUF1295 domain-containing protein [Mycoplasmoidaceae bacterium]